MTHEQMSNFTNKELSNFSHLELSLKSTELMINLINDFREDIPAGIILKLDGISKNFIHSCENNNIEISSEIAELKNKKHLTVIDIISILGSIASIISLAMSMFSSDNKTVNNTYINQITNYIVNEEYITNIDTTYIELKQTCYHAGHPGAPSSRSEASGTNDNESFSEQQVSFFCFSFLLFVVPYI